MATTCCPQYTIRLEANAFRPGKRQRRILSQFTRFVLTGSPDFGMSVSLSSLVVFSSGGQKLTFLRLIDTSPHPLLPKGRPGRGRQNKPFDLLEKLRLPESSQPIASSSSSSSTSSPSQTPRPHSFKVSTSRAFSIVRLPLTAFRPSRSLFNPRRRLTLPSIPSTSSIKLSSTRTNLQPPSQPPSSPSLDSSAPLHSLQPRSPTPIPPSSVSRKDPTRGRRNSRSWVCRRSTGAGISFTGLTGRS